MADLKNLDRLPESIRGKVADYIEDLLEIHGYENILSVFIYGSAASGDFIKGASDINSAVVFGGLDFEHFKRSLPLIKKWMKSGITAPLFLTPAYIKTSSDTFPVEFLEMKEANILVYGEDIMSNLAIDTANIRFVCEQQLKGRLIRIRQAYLEIGLNPNGIRALMRESLNSLLPIFRALLRLKGIPAPVRKEGLVETMVRTFGINKDLFAVIIDNKALKRLSRKNLESLLGDYMTQIERIADISDKL